LRCCARNERGAGTLLVALGCVVASLVAQAGLVLASVLVVRTRVAAAADLGALAAASAVLESEAVACARAAEIVRANAATMVACQVEGVRARVEVVSPAPAVVAWVTGGRTAHVRGRAQAELRAAR
jgi:secretion/DNA translocation related TadE-like protein